MSDPRQDGVRQRVVFVGSGVRGRISWLKNVESPGRRPKEDGTWGRGGGREFDGE